MRNCSRLLAELINVLEITGLNFDNHIRASVRAKGEHPFHVVKDFVKHRKTSYRGLAKNTAQLLTLFGLADLMLAKSYLIALHA